MTDSREIARIALKRMDRHEQLHCYPDGTPVFDDPDNGLLRYGRALRRVLALCDTWDREGLPSNLSLAELLPAIRQAIGFEMGVTQAPPEGSEP